MSSTGRQAACGRALPACAGSLAAACGEGSATALMHRSAERWRRIRAVFGVGWGRLRPNVVMWIDTHCHLDASEFDADRSAVIARARTAGVAQLVLPAVEVGNFATVRGL